MKYFLNIVFGVAVLMYPKVAPAESEDFKLFLERCGMGTLVGASIGILSVAVSDRPNENMGNIARGASLGLYGGIIFGLAKPSTSKLSDSATSNSMKPNSVWNFNLAPIIKNQQTELIVQSIYEF